MKTILYILVCLLLLTSCNEPVTEITKETASAGFNEELAKEVGADDYGMKKYIMAFLKTGPNRNLPKEASAKLQKAHMENIGRMAEAGKLVLAGPFYGGSSDLRGIYIFNVETLEEAKSLTESDPAIKAGSLIMELHPWYGSAALMKVNELHKQVAKVAI